MFIHQEYKGINMNLITFCKPNKKHVGDDSEHELGGFTVHNKSSWSDLIPKKLRARAHPSLLEFIIQVVCLWLNIIYKK